MSTPLTMQLLSEKFLSMSRYKKDIKYIMYIHTHTRARARMHAHTSPTLIFTTK